MLLFGGTVSQVAETGPLLDQTAAAEYLATTPRQVEELWAKRRLAGVKVGRKVRFRRCDLDEYAERNLVTAIRA